jgi:hypothetical protein
MKTCSRCKLEKPITDFNRQGDTKDGLTYKCKPCAAETTKQWAEKNRDHVRRYNNARYAANPCPRKAAAKAYREKNLEKSKESNRLWRIKNKEKVWQKGIMVRYNLSLETYESMFRSQNGCCKICSKQNLDGKRLFVDHDHKTGTVRGLLCHHCNAGMGHFFDNPDLIERVIKYLNESNSTETASLRN